MLSLRLRKTYRQLLCDLLDKFRIRLGEGPAASPIEPGVGVTLRTQVLINAISFRLQDTDAATVKPVRTTFASDVEPEIRNEAMKNTQLDVFYTNDGAI